MQRSTKISHKLIKKLSKTPLTNSFWNKNYPQQPGHNLFITTPKTSTFYLKPKIRKPNNPGRPIISACSCPTELISSFLDKKMAPFIKSLPTYIKDTNHALNILKQFSFPGNNKFLFNTDITSLYTVIPNNEGLLALLKILFRPTHCERTLNRHTASFG